MRQLPEEVTNFQKNSKNETIKKVQAAIDELRAEGFIITRKLILERSGVSNSVLSKPHIKNVLKENKVCQYSVHKKVTITNDVLLDLAKSAKKIEKLEKKVKELEYKLNKEKMNSIELKEANQILLGQLHILKQKARLKNLILD